MVKHMGFEIVMMPLFSLEYFVLVKGADVNSNTLPLASQWQGISKSIIVLTLLYIISFAF